MNQTLETAIAFHKAGLSVVPVKADGTKRPNGPWKQYQTSRATLQEIHTWFDQPGLGIGVVTGTISGGLELLEVEGRVATRIPELKELAHASGLGPVWDRITAGWFEISPSGGYHWLYRLNGTVPGNTKLAQAANLETIAETRGEGGFVVTAPSTGTVHPTGRPWSLLAGGPHNIPTITMDEREALHAVFAQLNEYTPSEPAPTLPDTEPLDKALTTPGSIHTDGTSPGDDYEAKTDWAQILTGWTHVFTRGNTRYWRRPGKTDPGFSATTGHADDRDRLYVFTTSTDFQPEVPYTKFGAYALLHHGGNHTNAAKALQAKGHGTDPRLNLDQLRQLRPTPTTQPAPAVDGTAALATVHNLDDRRADDETIAITDDGNALTLIHTYGHVLRYNPDRGRWLHWDGHAWQWQSSDGGQARELAKKIARSLPDDEGWKAHKKKSLSAKGITDLLVQARTDHRITVTIDELDARPWELNTPGGIINLRTGALEPADPAKLHTRITSCAPDFDADTTMWQSFLHQTFPGDGDLIGYMQRLVGYSAVGEVREHILPFAHGSGGNGKGVFLEAIKGVLGDYATTTPNGFLMKSNYAAHTTEIARLAGQRMVICSEVNEEDRFDEAKVKQLAGGDSLTARFMRQDDFTFKPTHQLWLMGNHQPAVESGGRSFWRRLRLIPFTQEVPEEQIIEDLQGILARDHGPAILAWIAQGAAAYAQGGLQEPAGVKAATEDYAHSVDTVGRFIEEECTLYPNPTVNHPSTTVAALRNAYEEWCRDNGETAIKGRAFQAQLRKHGVLTGRDAPKGTGGTRTYGGITINERMPDSKDEHDGDRGGF